MHLLEHYALTCGSFIRKPFILEKFYPLACDRYITFQPDAKASGGNYDYWNEAISLIYPFLEKNNIKIIQVGDGKEREFPRVERTNGKASLNQQAYIVKNSLMHFGADNFSVHLASAFDKKIVSLYSCSYPSQSGPFFSSAESVEFIEPERNGKKPSYSQGESVKSINSIKPEKIAKSILKALGIDHDIKIVTEYIGVDYQNKAFNIIPNTVIDIKKLGINGDPIIRMDLEFNQQNLHKQLALCKSNIVTDNPIHPDIIKNLKNRIGVIAYKITESHNVNFVKYLKANNVKYMLLSELPEDAIKDAKLMYMDYGSITPVKKKKKEDFEFSKLENLKYISSKVFFSNGKFYDSTAAWKIDRDTSTLFSSQPQDVIDSVEFWEQAESFLFVT